MFSRGSRSVGRHARDARSGRGRTRAGRSPAEEFGGVAERARPRADDSPPVAGSGGSPRLAGPYDAATAPSDGLSRLDLGSLKIFTVPGVELRVQAGPDGVVQQVHLVHGDSALQLAGFAAPRTESIWEEARAELRQTLINEGAEVDEVAGEYGTELRARVRAAQGLTDLRVVGVNGPRWLVRAVYQGPAAVDPRRAAPLAECLRGLVVERGAEARPAREPLPLRISDELAAQLQRSGPTGEPAGRAGEAGGPAGQGAGPPRRRPSPRPYRQ